MEELRYLSRLYYHNTVRFGYFERNGKIYLLLGFTFLICSIFLQVDFKLDKLAVGAMLIGGSLLAKARSIYDRNLVRHLSAYTLVDTTSVSLHKAVYLQTLVSHVDTSLFEAMRKFKEIRETAESKHVLASQSEWVRLCNFIYNPDAKNRILSLLIYLISLIALIVVPNSESDVNLYRFISSVTMANFINFGLLAVFFILLGYFLIVNVVVLAYKFIVVPLMLKTSGVDLLTRHFISELAKHAFLENRACQNS